MRLTALPTGLDSDYSARETSPIPGWLAPSLAAVGIGVLVGVLVVAASPVYLVAGLVGLVVVGVMLTDVRYAMIGFIAVATLLPFATIPVALGVVKPTLLDVCVMAILLVWLARLLADRR